MFRCFSCNILDWLLVNELHGLKWTSLIKRSNLAFTPGLWLYPGHEGESTQASLKITNTECRSSLGSWSSGQTVYPAL